MKSLVIGFASGMGNCVFMLPAVKALKIMGYRISLYVQTDFDTSPLWRRCSYTDEIVTDARVNGSEMLCGQWRPAAWKGRVVTQYQIPTIYYCEWKSNFRLAQDRGWKTEIPDVSDWCRDLDRDKRWDVGIAPGSKGGTWTRKRWPGMEAVAGRLLELGKSVAVFGLPEDGVESVPGWHVDTRNIGNLPDALAGCRILIGNDSGVTQLASSLGIPVVIVYTASSETKTPPIQEPNVKIAADVTCRPCVSTPRWHGCADWICHRIDPEKVVAAGLELLNKAKE